MRNRFFIGLSSLAIIILLFTQCSKSPAPSPAPPVTPPTTNPPPPDPGNTAAAFSLQRNGDACSNISVNGTYTQGAALTSSNSISVQVNVSTAGTWSISTNVVNGFSFSGSGTFASTGIQTVTLAGSGIPAASGSHSITITAGSSACMFQVNTNGLCETCGITLVRGIKFCGMSSSTYGIFTPKSFTSSDEVDGQYSLTLNLTSAGATIKAKLVNADKGTITWQDGYPFLFAMYMRFSNVNNYGSGPLTNPDTAGKLQIWVYREDGKDIIPAGNGKPAINKIVQVPGKMNVLDAYGISGAITLAYEYNAWWTYPGWNPNASYMMGLFSEPSWKLGVYNRRD